MDRPPPGRRGRCSSPATATPTSWWPTCPDFLADSGVPDDKLPDLALASMAVKSMVTMAVPDVLFEDGEAHRPARVAAADHLDPGPLARARVLLQRRADAAHLRRPRPAPDHPEHLGAHPAGLQPAGRLPRLAGRRSRTWRPTRCSRPTSTGSPTCRAGWRRSSPTTPTGWRRSSRSSADHPGLDGLGDHPAAALVPAVGRDRAVHAAPGQRRDPGPLRPARAARPGPARRAPSRPGSSWSTPEAQADAARSASDRRPRWLGHRSHAGSARSRPVAIGRRRPVGELDGQPPALAAASRTRRTTTATTTTTPTTASDHRPTSVRMRSKRGRPRSRAGCSRRPRSARRWRCRRGTPGSGGRSCRPGRG